MPIYLEPGDCVAVVVTTQGNIRPGFTYQVWMSAINGLAFDRACTQLEKRWNGLTGRPSYRRIITVHACADMVHPVSLGEFGVGLRRGGDTVASDRVTVFVREPEPPPDLPEPAEWQHKPQGAILCAALAPYGRVHDDDEPFETDDGVKHRARSAIYATPGFPLTKGNKTYYNFCSYGVVASSSSEPVTVQLTGTLLSAAGGTNLVEEDNGTKRCADAQTCMWASSGFTIGSTIGYSAYVTGVHDITSNGHTLRKNSSGGAVVDDNHLVPATLPDR